MFSRVREAKQRPIAENDLLFQKDARGNTDGVSKTQLAVWRSCLVPNC